VELALQVDVGEPLVLRLLGVGDDDERRERDPLVAAQRQPRLERQAELDLVHSRERGRGDAREDRGRDEARRARGSLYGAPAAFPELFVYDV
jgi:hypothetical protein